MSGFSEEIEQLVRKAFNPSLLEVINESHLHAGHQEHFDGSGETHLRIRIISDVFSGMNRVERHRQMNRLMAPFMDRGLHAIAMEIKAPGE